MTTEQINKAIIEEAAKKWPRSKGAFIAGAYFREELDLNNPDRYEVASTDILREVRRAKTMFKADFVNQHEGYAVILEELDELWEEVKKNQKVYDIAAQRKEAIQCAAMCIRFVAELCNPQPSSNTMAQDYSVA